MRSFLALPLTSLLTAAAPPVAITPAGPNFASGANEYRLIWEAEGARIVSALEKAAGVPFPPTPIEVLVSDARPMTSFDGRFMRLRAGYTPAYKKGTLVHEMGHRLAFTLPQTAALDDHRLLYLFLYDAWSDLYGSQFADRMVSIERRIPGPYDAAWTWALAQTREQRRARLEALRARGA